MRKIYTIFLAVLLIITLVACQKSNVDEETANHYIDQAKSVIEHLLNSEYEEVYEQFNEEMKEELSLSNMGDLTPVIKEVGEFEKFETSAVEERDGYYVTVVVTKHEDGKLGFTITFEEDDSIAGLFIK